MEKVPFFGLAREYQHYKSDYQNIFDKIMSTGMVLQGREVTQFEEALALETGRKYAVAVNSCTDALYFSLMACGIGHGDEVIVSNFSFIASASCIMRAGGTVVLCDTDEENFHLSLESIKKMKSAKTKAVIFPHMFGSMSCTKEIETYTKDNGMQFIEDAAQSLGASFKGRKAGSLGVCSSISFDPTKVLGAPGSGGAFLTDDEEMAATVKKLRYHGKGSDNTFQTLGYNSQMPSITASILNFKLSKSKEWATKRQEIAEKYSTVFGELGLISQKKTDSVNHIFHKYVLKTKTPKERDALFEYLSSEKIQVMIHYRKPMSDNGLFDNTETRVDECTNIKNNCARVLSLPIHPWLSSDEVSYIIEKVQSFFKR